MVFNPLIPQSTDFISQSQCDMLVNFRLVDSIWGQTPNDSENVGDHISLTSANVTRHGKHKKITAPQQASDPSTGSNEVALYSKDNSGTTELYYRRESSGDVNRLTDDGAVNMGGLVLRAFVAFDQNGNILENREVDGDGLVTLTPMSSNVASVVVNTAGSSDWTITFTNALPTDDYMWIYQAFMDDSSAGVVHAQPKNDATYGNVITTTTFNAYGYTMTPTGPVVGRFDRIYFQAFTVA